MDKNLRDNAEKLFRIQRQAKEDVKTMQGYISDLLSWENEMKRKEAVLQAYEQDLPPVRSKKKRGAKPRPARSEPRINAFDYASWDKFDVDKAIEQVDMADVGPSSLDSKKSLPAKNAKLSEEAAYEKERGNQFVKNGNWEAAIKCYNRAIEINHKEAIFYANRALCYLKLDKLHHAESDCTKALCLDSTYVKALLRRATAREKLGSLKAASEDLAKVLELEPNNGMAKKQLTAIKIRMGSKGGTSKSSPQKSPIAENKKFFGAPNVQEMKNTIFEVQPREKTELQKWRDGDGENLCVIKPVKKPPHLRSKRPLKPITIKEIPFGRTEPELPKPATRIQITDVDDLSHGDTNNNKNNKNSTKVEQNEKKPTDKGDLALSNGIENDQKIIEIDKKVNCDIKNDDKDEHVHEDKHVIKAEHVNKPKDVPKDDHVIKDEHVNKKHDNKANEQSINILVAPSNSVQFMLEWRSLKDVEGGRSDYLSLINPAKIPQIFDNALESDVLSSVLHTLAENPEKFKNTIAKYLRGLAETKRFSALAMFLSSKDKHLVNNLLVQCKEKEVCSEEFINDLKNKYEI